MFGLTPKSRKKALQKVENTRLFLDNNFVEIGGQSFAYSQFTKNSFINPQRYIAEINNRVNSLFTYAQSRDLQNVFLTLTLPSEYHRTKTLDNGKVVKNYNYGRLKCCSLCNKKKTYPIDYNYNTYGDIDPEKEKYYPKNATKELSKMFKLIMDKRSFRNITKEDRVYFRVTEPHKDGTPHLHISIFIPPKNVIRFVDAVKRKFPSPAAEIETQVRNPVAYLMKYILKTLDDLRADNQKLTDLTLWYILHGICRIYTSRTLISLDVYRVLGGRYTLNELTVMYKEKEISVLLDPLTNKPMEIFNSYGEIWKRKTSTKTNINYDSRKLISKTLTKINHEQPIKIKQGFHTFNYFAIDDILEELPIVPSQMQDYQLYDYYSSLDIEEVPNLVHFGITQNEMIKRGLIDGQIQSLNDFNTEIGA